MQARRAHGDHDIARTHAIRAQHAVGFHDADAGGRQIEVVGSHQPGMFGSLTAEQCAAGDGAPSAIPATSSLTRSGTTLPTAM